MDVVNGSPIDNSFDATSMSNLIVGDYCVVFSFCSGAGASYVNNSVGNIGWSIDGTTVDTSSLNLGSLGNTLGIVLSIGRVTNAVNGYGIIGRADMVSDSNDLIGAFANVSSTSGVLGFNDLGAGNSIANSNGSIITQSIGGGNFANAVSSSILYEASNSSADGVQGTVAIINHNSTLTGISGSYVAGSDLTLNDIFNSSIFGDTVNADGLEYSALYGSNVNILLDPSYDFSFIGADALGNINTRINANGYDSWLNLAGGEVGIGTATPTAILSIAGSGGGGNAGLQIEGVAVAPALSGAGAGRIYYNSTSNQFECSVNGGAYSACVLGGTNIYNTSSSFTADRIATMAGFDLTFDGSGQDIVIADDGSLLVNTSVPVAGKVAVFNGDIDVAGIIDPYAVQFSGAGIAGGYQLGVVAGATQRPIYVSPDTNNTEVFQVRRADDTTVVLNVDTTNERVGISTTTPTQKLDVNAGNIDIDNTTSANPYGIITKNNSRFAHNFNYGNNGTVTTNGDNTFVGLNAGNLTMGATATNAYEASDNTAFGASSLDANTIGYQNTAVGADSLGSNTSGSNNIAMGARALYSNTTGSDNNAVGSQAMQNNTTGYSNVAVGAASLNSNTSGYHNIGLGQNSLFSNLSGYNNTALGANALHDNTTGYQNLAVGDVAMYSNTTGNTNAAVGNGALQFNTTGNYNSAFGNNALQFSTTGTYNAAIGHYSLNLNSTGYGNVAVGNQALYNNTTGYRNSALGHDAGTYISDGVTANQTSFQSIYIGALSMAQADGDQNEIVIGYNAAGLGTNTVVLGNSNITTTSLRGDVGIGTNTPANKLDVTDTSDDTPASFTGTSGTCTVDTFGGTLSCVSDEKLKTNILSLDSGLEAVLALRGVTYNWKSSAEGQAVAGFIAQEVEAILPNLVSELDDGTKSLDKIGMIPYIVEAIKTQDGKLEGINTQLAEQGLQINNLSEDLKALAAKVEQNTADIEQIKQENLDYKAKLGDLETRLQNIEQTP